MITPSYDHYIEPARKYPQIWRLVLGFLLIVVVYIAVIVLVMLVLWAVLGSETSKRLLPEMGKGSTPMGMGLLFLSFAGAFIGPMLAAKWVHKRAPGTLFGPRARVLHDFALGASVVMAVLALSLFIWGFWFEPVPNLPLGTWLALLPLTLLGLLLQTGAEELVFRGYLQQQLTARFRSPLIWMVLPSLGFAALHYDPETLGDNIWLIILSTGLFGLVAADLTRISGSIGASWGFHFANNLWAIALIAMDKNLTGLALYITPYGSDDTTLMPRLITGDLLAMGLAWYILRRRLSR